jgi:hypothetical protein
MLLFALEKYKLRNRERRELALGGYTQERKGTRTLVHRKKCNILIEKEEKLNSACLYISKEEMALQKKTIVFLFELDLLL